MKKNLITEENIRDQVRTELATKKVEKVLEKMHGFQIILSIITILCIIVGAVFFSNFLMLACWIIFPLMLFIILHVCFTQYRKPKLLKKYKLLALEEEISKEYREKLKELWLDCNSRISKTKEDLDELGKELEHYQNLINS